MTQEVLILPALSQTSFDIGMCYDSRNNQIISGTQLWPQELIKEHIQVNDQEICNAEFLTSDNIQSKMDAMNVNGNLKLSILCGAVSAYGSGKYLYDHKKTSETVRSSLQCATRLQFKRLNIFDLGEISSTHQQVFDHNIATHVVTAIEYGCDAIFVFERSMNEEQTNAKTKATIKLGDEVTEENTNDDDTNDEKKDETGSLKLLSLGRQALIALASNISGSLGVTYEGDSNDKERFEEIKCTFHGDFLPSSPLPTNLKDAISLIEKLPDEIKSVISKNKAVPKTVHLYPLYKLDTKAAKIVRDISEADVNLVQNYFQQIINAKAILSSLKERRPKKTGSSVPFIAEEIEEFTNILYRIDFSLKESIVPILSKIRGGTADEAKLEELLKTWENSAYNPLKIIKTLEKGFILYTCNHTYKKDIIVS